MDSLVDFDIDFDEFIREQDAKNTIKGNMSAWRCVSRYMSGIGEKRAVHNIPPVELDRLLSRFFMEVLRADGKPYQPDVLSTMHRGLKRYLDTKNYGINILKDEIFAKSRKVLAARRKKLKRDGYGGRPNATRELTLEEVDRLWEEGFFGLNSGVQVQRALWWSLSIHCGWRGCDEARQVAWGDISIETDKANGQDYLIWNVERGSKTRIGREGEEGRKYNPTIFPSGNKRCPVRLFKIFRDHRPDETMVEGFSFFLGIDWKKSEKDKIWYTNRAMGRNKIAEFLPEAKKLLKLPGKVANHSVRKTGISQLLEADIPEIFVAQHSGMKNRDSLKSYKTASLSHQKRMCNILNDITSEKSQTVKSSEIISATAKRGTNNPLEARNSGLFAGAIFSICNIYTGNVYHQDRIPLAGNRFRLLSDREEELLNLQINEQ